MHHGDGGVELDGGVVQEEEIDGDGEGICIRVCGKTWWLEEVVGVCGSCIVRR